MSNYTNLRNGIISVIKTNGNNEITGQFLQNELLAMITTLGYGYQFMGIATPTTTPGTPDAKVFYIAYTPGTYTNFGGIAVTGLCVLKYATSWVKEDIPVSGGGGSDFTVEPTDLTLESGDPNRLKFADRLRESNITTGKNYVILRENMTFANQLTISNAIYEIRYDFDLNNATVQVPANSVFRFVGGSLKNGTLSTNPFGVIADNDKSIFTNITFDSSYITNQTIYVDWFDFVTDGTTDNFNAFKRLENLINTKGGGNIVFGLAKTYAVKTILTYLTNIYVASENSGLLFDSCANLDVNLNGSTIKLLPSNTPWSMVFTIVNCEYAKIHNGKIVGDRLGHDYTAYINYAGETSTSFEWNYGVRQCGGYLELADLDISQCVGDGVQVGGNSAGSGRNYSGRYYIHDCEISFCGRNGITCHSSYDTNTIERTFIHDIAMDNIPSFSPKAAIDIEFEDGMNDVPLLVFDSLIVDNCNTGITSAVVSVVKGFVLSNSIIRKANLSLGNMATASPDAECIVDSCSIEMTDDFNGSVSNYLGKTIFRDCNFVGLRGIVTSPKLYDGCSFSTSSDSTKLVVTGSAFPNGGGTVFPETNNCVFEVNAGFIQITNTDKIKNTFFHFGENVNDVRFASVTFTGCRFKTDVAVNKNTTNSGTGDVVYKNCVIEWIGATQKVINDYNAAQITIFDGCLLKGTLIQSYGGRVKASNCLFNDCEITKVNKAGVGKDIYSSCSFYECKGTNTGAIDFNDCILISETARDKKDVLGIGNYYDFWGNYVFNGCTIYARNFTNNTRATYCTYHNCTLDIDSAYLTGAKIYNGVVKSTTANRATEFVNSVYLLNGVETPARSGATADRPTASSVGVGFTYFDTDLGKMIVSNGTAYVNMDGTPLS